MKILLGLLLSTAVSSWAQIPDCVELSDNFCEKLWDQDKLGNLETPLGSIEAGKSKKSYISRAYQQDIMALINAFPRLPAPLRTNPGYARHIRELSAHMKKENPSKEWELKLHTIYGELNATLELIVHQLFVKKYPQFKNKSDDAYRPTDWANYLRISEDLSTAIIEAKIGPSSQWGFVRKVFKDTRKKVLEVIDSLALPELQKEILRSRIAAIELSLPFTDKELLGARGTCAKTERGAFYDYYRNKITVCGGYFYAFRTEAALAHVLAHEMGHALDLTQTHINTLPDLPVGRALQEILQHEGPIEDCRSWNAWVKAGTWSMPEALSPNDHGPFRAFKQCLVKKADLAPFEFGALKTTVSQMVGNYMSGLASNKVFSLLATPKVYKEGKLATNHFYLRPDLKAMRDSDYTRSYRYTDGSPTTHFFVYSLLCEEGKDKPRDFGALPEGEKVVVFTDAMKRAQAFSEGHLIRILEHCGDECPSLVGYKLALPSAENFADWIASKATTLLIKDLKPELRRDFIAEMGATLCKPYDTFHPLLMSAERRFSRAPHAESRARRKSMLTREMAELAQCQLRDDPDIVRCEL